MLLIAFLLLSGMLVSARMYQWDDPESGTPQVSGKPPWWYRSDEPGPRVYVIENGRVVDDTAVSVPDSQRQQLREAAFRRAEQDEARLKAKLEEAQRLQAERARRREQEVAEAEAKAPAAAATPAEEKPAAEKDAASEVEAMRALVEEWEKVREESAKKIVHP
ncbi:MAG: hypothetical protein HYR49_04695 [Gammaproteobacteria bacterium]|nr:hypothetical protein [Gammaproteobacteria bacterium]